MPQISATTGPMRLAPRAAAPDVTALVRPAAVAHLLRALAGLSLTRFLAVGCVGLLTDGSLYRLFVGLGAGEPLARALSLAAATLVTWRLNRRFTFAPGRRSQAAESSGYALVALGAQGVSYTIFLSLRALLPGVPDLCALFAGAVIATAFSFTGQRFFTFARASDRVPTPGALLAALRRSFPSSRGSRCRSTPKRSS